MELALPQVGSRAASPTGTCLIQDPQLLHSVLEMCTFSRLQAAPKTPFQLLDAHCLWLLALGHAEVFTGGSQGQEGSHPGPQLTDSPPGHI